MSQNLYNYLVQNGDYTKSYDDFKSQFDTVASQSALYNYMNENETYTKSQQEFLNQFFSEESKSVETAVSEIPQFESDNIQAQDFQISGEVAQSIESAKLSEDQEKKIQEDYANANQQIANIKTAWAPLIEGIENFTDQQVIDEVKKYRESRKNSALFRDTRGFEKEEALKKAGINSKGFIESKSINLLNDSKQGYLNNEAIKQYVEQNFSNENERQKFYSDLFDADGQPTAKYSNLLKSEEFLDIKNNLEIDDEVIKKSFETSMENDAFKANLSQQVKDLEGFDFDPTKGEEQIRLEKEGVKQLEKLTGRKKEISDSFLTIQNDLKKISEQRAEIKNYFENTDIKSKIEELQNRQYNSQEEIDEAQKEYQELIKEYQTKIATDNALIGKYNQYINASKELSTEMEGLEVSEEELKDFVDVFKRNHEIGAILGNSLLNATIDLGQGIISAADMVAQIPYELINAVDGNAAKAYLHVMNANQSNLLGKNSIWDKASKNLDQWQEGLNDNIMEPIQFDNIDSFSDFGYWASSAVVGQIPQLALMYVTGGMSLAVLGASSAGSKFNELEAQKELFDKTGGLYGQDLSFGSMFLNATFTGGMESLSERITLGQVRTFKGAIKGINSSANLGFKQGLKKNMFTFDNTKYVAKDILEEGGTEVVATMSSNLADILSGDKEKSIYEGVKEAFVTGALVSSSMKLGGNAGKLMRAPFTSRDSNQKIGENSDKITGLMKQLEDNSLSETQREDIESEIARITQESNLIISQDIKRIDALKPNDKEVLIEIESENYKLRKKAEDILANENTTQEQKNNQIALLQRRVDNNLDAKDAILAQYKAKDVDKSYARQKDNIDAYNRELEKRGAPTITLVEAKDQSEMEDFIARERTGGEVGLQDIANVESEVEGMISGLQNIINTSEDQAEIDAAKKEIARIGKQKKSIYNSLDLIQSDAKSYGGMIAKVNKKGNIIGYTIGINKAKALKKGRFSTPAHEFIHAAWYNTLKADPSAKRTLGSAIFEVLRGNDVTFKRGMVNAFNERLSLYERNDASEEALTQSLEMYMDGDIEISQTGFQKLAGVARRFAQNFLGYDISLDTPADIKKFIVDYAVSVNKNKPNKAILRMMTNGAKGKMFKDARTPEQRKAEAKFSREADLENKLQDGKISDSLDKFVMNEDGSPKHSNAQEFKSSNDFYDGYSTITSSKVLDGLIKKDMISLGLQPEKMSEFIRKVKDKLGERYLKNYNYDINKSLFGWLTGVSGGGGMSIIYRAKGDVIKEFNQRGEGETISYEQPTGDKTTIADTIKADQDSYLEKLDNEIIIPGRKNIAKEIVNDLLAVNVLGLSQDAKNSIENTINNFEGEIKSYDYKDIKNLISKVKKIERKGRLVNPTKTSDAVPEGALYSILETISSHFGVDPLKILANQDLTAAERANAQSLIYNRSVNENGNYDSSMYDILPEGETRSGQATGVANTKLTSFYTTGERLKVSEGAKKELGQKKEQSKRKDVGKEEFLRMFGINSDGTFENSKEFDGAIRAFIVQKAVLAANQGLRLKSIANGTDTEAIIAKLADGKSEIAFSADRSLINEAALLSSDIDALKSVIGKSGLNLNKAQVNKLANEIKRISNTVATKEKLSLRNELIKIDSLDKSEFLGSKISKVGSDKSKLNTFDRLRANFVGNVERAIDKHGLKKGVERVWKYHVPSVASATRAGDASVTFDKPGGKAIEQKDKSKIKNNRKQFTEGNADVIALIKKALPEDVTLVKVGAIYQLQTTDGNLITELDFKTSDQTVEGVIKEIDKNGIDKMFADRKTEGSETISEIKDQLDASWQKVEDGILTEVDFALIITSMFSNMTAPIRRAAFVNGLIDIKDLKRLIKQGKKQGLSIGKIIRYEHNPAANVIAVNILRSYLTTGSLDMSIFDNYTVNLIPAKHASVVDLFYKDSSPEFGSRYFSKEVLLYLVGNPSAREFILPITKSDNTVEGDLELELLDSHLEGTSIVNKLEGINKNSEINKISLSKDVSPRGMSTFDFDETLIIDGKNFIEATKDGETIKISSAQWPIEGSRLEKEGYTFKFDDFVNVRGGVEGPLMQKLRNRIKKFGPENNYILTARPQESATAIHGWLKSKGINIPLKNITGLGNSTAEAKAQWMLGKFAEGYNDMYFVDDALPNVDAVDDVIQQLDIKGKAVQAKIKFSKEADSIVEDVIDGGKSAKEEINLDVIIEESKGLDRNKKFSTAKAKLRGKRKNRFTFFLPPSAEDLTGLIYPMLGKGKQGEKHYKFFKEKIFDPYAKAVRAVNLLKQQVATNYKNLRRTAKDVSKRLNKRIPDSDFTLDQAIRVYNYVQAGFDIPGLSQADQNALVNYVNSNKDVKAFADNVDIIQRNAGGLIEPDDAWLANTISSELNDITDAAREVALSEWQQNVETIFSEQNLNKIQAVFGTNHRVALENVLYRMRLGTNRVQTGDNFFGGMMNRFNDWINGSIGATMFINARSALLQTLSTVNFVNWSDNNPLKFAKAVGNVKQYTKDLAFIFNSPFLKQRRSGLQQDVNAREMAEAIAGAKNPIRKAIGYLLQKGFTPTQIADSFAIASGGAAFYRNRINTYLAEGMSKKDAEAKAFNDMQEIAEATQQSARPDKISMQQASPLGKLILAFQNTPMQYNRLMKRAFQDLVNRRGDVRTHISKIVYYGAVQNAIFYSMQQALFALAFGDDDEEEEKVDAYARVGNGMLDSVLRGSGFMGAAVSTMKNVVLEFLEQEEKKHRADHAYTIIEAFNYSPPIGIKARKLYSATQTWEFNRDVIKEMPLTDIDNPVYQAATSAIEGLTNAPVNRAYGKIRNVREAMNSDNETYKRVALLLGWSTWNFGIQNEDVIEARQQVKERKKKERKEKRDAEQTEKNRILEEKFLNEQKQEKKEGKEVTCAAANKAGVRCKNKPVDGIYCTVHQKVEQGNKQVQCKKIKKDGKRCKMQTKNKSGLCYYHD